MDVELKCPCGGELALADAPEAMACNTVFEWTSAHAQCVINVQLLYADSDDDDDDEEVAAKDGDEADGESV